jgi:antitoxin component YwqK of YwqJK toxin-antitoxin module
MRNFRLPLVALFIAPAAAFCQHDKVKVIEEEYSNGKPKIVYYFDSKEDAMQHPTIEIRNGIGYASKPISFDKERYYENGRLDSKGRYIKGQTCGLWQYFYETGVRQARCYYWNGVTRDSVYCWYPSGNLKRIMAETDTTNHYWHIFQYFDNGIKSFESNLLKDSLNNWKLEGEWAEWYENGKPKIKAILKDNWTVGKWQQWDSAGKLQEGDKPLRIRFD